LPEGEELDPSDVRIIIHFQNFINNKYNYLSFKSKQHKLLAINDFYLKKYKSYDKKYRNEKYLE
jgi:hypothetical protein